MEAVLTTGPPENSLLFSLPSSLQHLSKNITWKSESRNEKLEIAYVLFFRSSLWSSFLIFDPSLGLLSIYIFKNPQISVNGLSLLWPCSRFQGILEFPLQNGYHFKKHKLILLLDHAESYSERTAAALNDFRTICVISPLYWHKYGKAAWIYENESETKAAVEFYVPTAFLDFPSGDSDKEPACQCGRCVFNLWARPPGGGHGNPLQYSCLENPTDREVWWATVHPWGCKESHMAETT